jgi:hypothetical protein
MYCLFHYYVLIQQCPLDGNKAQRPPDQNIVGGILTCAAECPLDGNQAHNTLL